MDIETNYPVKTSVEEEEELKSLAHYVGDEEMLVNQMFSAIHGTNLEAMMPSALKVSIFNCAYVHIQV